MILCEHIYKASFVFNNLSNVVGPSRTSCLPKYVLIRDMARRYYWQQPSWDQTIIGLWRAKCFVVVGHGTLLSFHHL